MPLHFNFKQTVFIALEEVGAQVATSCFCFSVMYHKPNLMQSRDQTQDFVCVRQAFYLGFIFSSVVGICVF